MQVIDLINGSALFAQSAYSASIATKDNLGRDITATYLTGVSIPESATWNDVSTTVQTNSAQWADGGSGDEEVNSFVYNNSATINEVNTSYQTNSGTFLTAVDLSPYYTTAEANTLSSMLSGAIDFVSANAGGVISSYTTATIEGTNAINSLNRKPIMSFRTQSAQEAGNAKYANSAYYDIYGHNLAQNYFDITALSSRLTANSGNWNEISAYQTNSATYLTAHQAISADEWNSNYETVNTNSGVWGGSALPISAGNGINLSMVDGILVISLA